MSNETLSAEEPGNKLLLISPRTLLEWEQGRRNPSGPAKVLIEIAFRHREVILEGLELRG